MGQGAKNLAQKIADVPRVNPPLEILRADDYRYGASTGATFALAVVVTHAGGNLAVNLPRAVGLAGLREAGLPGHDSVHFALARLDALGGIVPQRR